MPKITSSHPALTPERLARVREARRKIVGEERPALVAKARAAFARHEVMVELLAALKAARVEAGLTLAEVGELSGIGKENLSRLENAERPNPTWDTLGRYAEAIGRRIRFALA